LEDRQIAMDRAAANAELCRQLFHGIRLPRPQQLVEAYAADDVRQRHSYLSLYAMDSHGLRQVLGIHAHSNLPSQLAPNDCQDVRPILAHKLPGSVLVPRSKPF
jgi:hypothetical protein